MESLFIEPSRDVLKSQTDRGKILFLFFFLIETLAASTIVSSRRSLVVGNYSCIVSNYLLEIIVARLEKESYGFNPIQTGLFLL